MGYAIKLYFDEKSAAPIYKIWQSLADARLADFMIKSGSRPGLTLGLWEQADGLELNQSLSAFAEKFKSPTKVLSYGVATFPTDPAQVFLGIVPAIDLIEFHKIFHNFDRSLFPSGSEYYNPGNWVPHSTLAIRCPPQDIAKIMEVCLAHETRFELKISTIGLLETGTARQIAEFKIS